MLTGHLSHHEVERIVVAILQVSGVDHWMYLSTCGQFHWFFEASTEFGPSPFVSVATNSGILRWTLTQIKRWNKPNKSMSTA